MTATNTTRAHRPCQPGIRHTYADYSHGRCRCNHGREAWRLYGKRRREGRHQPLLVDATGSQRRLQGLLALGWPREVIAAKAGLADQARVRQILAAERVRSVTADGVRRVARQLGVTCGPSVEVRAHARDLGYVSLWAWDEDTIDDPAVQPEGVPSRTRATPPVPDLTPAMLYRFDAHAVPEPGGPHIRWTGATDAHGRGKLSYGPKTRRTTVSARKVAYLRHTGEQPAGPVVPRCGNGWCVAGPCMVEMGEQRKAAA